MNDIKTIKKDLLTMLLNNKYYKEQELVRLVNTGDLTPYENRLKDVLFTLGEIEKTNSTLNLIEHYFKDVEKQENNFQENEIEDVNGGENDV